jgi:hypothetical protein
VKSHHGTPFRQWATQRLRIVKPARSIHRARERPPFHQRGRVTVSRGRSTQHRCEQRWLGRWPSSISNR